MPGDPFTLGEGRQDQCTSKTNKTLTMATWKSPSPPVFSNSCIRVDDAGSIVLLWCPLSLRLLFSLVPLLPLVQDLPLLAERAPDVHRLVRRLREVQTFGFGPSVTVPVPPMPGPLLGPLVGPELACHPVSAAASAPVIGATRLLLAQVDQGLGLWRLWDGDGDGHGRLGERYPHRHGGLGQVSRAGPRGEGGPVVGGGGRFRGVLRGVAEQLLSARHLAPLAQLVGPLLPHWHVDLPPPIAAIGEGFGAVEGLLVGRSRYTVGFVREVGAASVDSSFPVQVGSPPSTEEQNEDMIKMGTHYSRVTVTQRSATTLRPLTR